MVEAVFWDIGGVILDAESVRRAHEAFVERLLEEYAPERSVEDAVARNSTSPRSQTHEDAVEAWRTAVGEYFRERDGTEFRPARTAYDRGVAAVAGRSIPEEEWRPVFEAVTAETLRPEPGAVETVERLADTDLHVGVVSDVDTEEGLRILETFGVRERFDSMTTSEMVGRTKPHREMFETALREADASPDEAVMIGDRYDHDVAGAAAVGLTTIAYGADDGPEVDYRVEDLREVLDIVGARDGDEERS